MKHIPVKILFLCILLPSICYVLTLQALEGYLQRYETTRLNRTMIRNYKALYEGRYPVSEEIDRNIEAFLEHRTLYRLGVRTSILVKTRDNRILYPLPLKDVTRSPGAGSRLPEPPEKSLNFVEVAAENYRILNSGLILSVDVRIRRNSWLSNGILILYVLAAMGLLQRVLRKRVRETERKEEAQRDLIRELSGRLATAEARLQDTERMERRYREKIERLSEEKKGLARDIEGFMDEMEDLEAGLKDQQSLREEMELEVLYLEEELNRLRNRAAKPRQRKKKADAARKRFKVLYKNLTFTDRAVEGFLALPDDFQLKAEAVIHRLNEDAGRVSVKRKVFGKGGKLPVLETDFSYSGRIYFRKDSRARTRIVCIGTKNTQEKDLTFIENLG